MNSLQKKVKATTLCGLLLIIGGCVVSETYLVHRCTTIFSKVKCVDVGLEVVKDRVGEK